MKARNFQLRICAAISLLILGANHGWADNGAGRTPRLCRIREIKQGRPKGVHLNREMEVKHLFPEGWPISLRGWVSGGYTFNGKTPSSHFNGPYNEVDRNRPVLNQFYFIAEKTLGDKEGINFGGRFDVLFGNDFFLAQSNGLERHQNAPQNGTNSYMVSRFRKCMPKSVTVTVSIKVGHFYTIIGYEGVPAPSNFFYSKSYSYQFAGPFTHWGGLATANITPQLNFSSGSGKRLGRIETASRTSPGIIFAGLSMRQPTNSSRVRWLLLRDKSPP